MTSAVNRLSLLAGRGMFARVPRLCANQRVLVVASRRTALQLRVRSWLPADARVFTEFRPNPTMEQATNAARAREDLGAGLVLGIGGGSALDVAKAARVLPPPNVRTKLILVPTTAGTGSEVTRFATLYQDGRKVSLDADDVLADVAVVDAALTESCPPPLTWSCAFDALSHAVESLWSLHATDLSRHHAEAALTRLIPILHDAGPVPTPAEREVLSEAGTLAGRAIDITRTTAAHALAYPLTVHLGVPHGLACALNLTWLTPLVEERLPRFAAIRTLRGLFGGSPGEIIATLLRRRGLPTRCRANAAEPRTVDLVLHEGLSSNRISGTPIQLDPSRVRSALTHLIGGEHA